MSVRRWILLLAVAAPLLASAAPAPGHDRPSLALVGVSKGEGFTPAQLSTIEEMLVSALDHTERFNVIGRGDVDAMLSLEAKKQAFGCTDNSCMAEIAGALGVDYVASASVGRLGQVTVLNLKVIDVKTARALVHAQQTATTDSELVQAATALANEAASRLPPPRQAAPNLAPKPTPANTPPPVATTASPMVHRWGLALLGVGAAALIAGTVLQLHAHNQTSGLKSNPRPGAEVPSLVSSINASVIGGSILLVGGGASAVVGTTLAVKF